DSREGNLTQIGAVRIDRPYFITAAAIRDKRDLLSIRRPARVAIKKLVVGQVAPVRTVAAQHRQIVLRPARHTHYKLLPIRRKLGTNYLTISARDPVRFADRLFPVDVKLHGLNV